ncbi:putative leucine aminopeptidase 2 [Rhexocercosporidium sp. MPI-PUGE-AT-0058]|nr:putative leucine aminopeptidase 2 [Rhexocercosporidium sp. MPI-PUGE-AT-0058]
MRFTQSIAAAVLAFVAATTAVSVPSTDAKEIRAVKPLVESNKLRRVMTRSALLAKANKLQEIAYATPGRNRLIGTAGHEGTVAWITSVLDQYPDYYTYYLQPLSLSVGAGANLTIGGVVTEAFAVDLAPAGTVSAPVVSVANLACDLTDFPPNTAGKIALVFRGTCQSGIKAHNAFLAGAVGMIVYNNDVGTLEGYSLQILPTAGGPYVPTSGITRAEGLALVARLAAGETVVAGFTTKTNDIVTNNIIAETIEGDHDNVIHISGHSDSVAAGPGINDNGSGTISILEVAIQLTSFSVNNAVRFSWWTAEESGLLGASYYVSQSPQSELNKIRLMLDFDMMASPNYAFQVYDGDGSAFGESGPPGSAEAEYEFERFFVEEMGENFTQIEFDGRSDYGPFLEAGVATGGIACGAEGVKTVEEAAMFGGVAGEWYDKNYHQAGDTVKNLNMGAWIVMTKSIAHMTATFARSFELLPPNTKANREKRMEHAKRMSAKAVGKTWGI